MIEQNASQPLSDDTTDKGLLNRLKSEVSQLNFDMEAFAWGCEMLWHSEFRKGQDNEELSRFPVAVIRMVSLQTARLAEYVERIEDITFRRKTER